MYNTCVLRFEQFYIVLIASGVPMFWVIPHIQLSEKSVICAGISIITIIHLKDIFSFNIPDCPPPPLTFPENVTVNIVT